MVKRYEELTIADDFMFGKVMEDMELCRDSLERLLQNPVLSIHHGHGSFKQGEILSGVTGRKGIISLHL